MNRLAAVCIWLFALFQFATADELDRKLQLVAKVYSLVPKQCPLNDDATLSTKEVAGKVLFESKSLSGNRDISCSDCHLRHFGTADGLPMAVGVGGHGEGYERLNSSDGALVQRNAIALTGRGDPAFTSFFWDGKVQFIEGRIVTQFGDNLPRTIESPLAAAAMLPLIERDEFIGVAKPFRPNDIQKAVEDKLYFSRYLAVGDSIRDRLMHPETKEDRDLADAIVVAGVELPNFELADAGNLIAEFISKEFSCVTSDWDEYLKGDLTALTEAQKQGAVLFYGKGRCASCHSGPLFSDFLFHSIATPQGYFGPHTRHRDIGRAAVTHRTEDLHLFRTPPLIDVRATSPYGHNGAFATLRDVVVHHFNPLQHYVSHADYFEGDFFRVGTIMESRARVLATIDISSYEELDALLEFLQAI